MAVIKPISKHDTLVNNKVKNYLLGTGQFESKYHGERCKKITYINIPPDDYSKNH